VATAAVLLGFLEVAGYAFGQAFPRQAPKLMTFVRDSFAPALKAGTTVSHVWTAIDTTRV